MSENATIKKNNVIPLSDPILLDLTDAELVSLIRGVKVDVEDLNLRISVGGNGARQNWAIRRRLEFVVRHRMLAKKDQSE